MSRHWKPTGGLERVRDASARPRWPEGATAGLVLIAAGCIGLAVVLYKVAGPRDVFGP
jgi:hypothetical protein